MVDISLDGIGDLLTSLREAVTGKKILDVNEVEKLNLELTKIEQALNLGQIEVNKVEAAHKNMFVAGWRPFIGWVCGIAIAYAFILQPVIIWMVALQGIDVQPPEIESDTLYQLVLAMLGMAGLRTYEKQAKVSRER